VIPFGYDYLDEIGFTGRLHGIEITEGLLLDNRAEVTNKLLHFRNSGVQISLDDFGTGYSAMAYLKRFPIDILEDRQVFRSDMVTDPGDQALSSKRLSSWHTNLV